MPVVVISARSHEKDKVEALDLGADDYITKPFGTSEMLARIRAAIRHSRTGYQGPAGGMTGVFEAKDLLIDYDKHRAYKGGLDLNLTQNEFRLVSLLSRYAGKVLTYDFMIREIWGPNMENNNRILRVNMANIRRKLEKKSGTAGVYFYRNRRRLPDDRAGGLTKTRKQEEKKRCELEWDMMCIDCRRAAN